VNETLLCRRNRVRAVASGASHPLRASVRQGDSYCGRACVHEVVHRGGCRRIMRIDPGRKEGETMIARIWHGWTARANADRYEVLLKQEIFVGIRNRGIDGFEGIQLLRRDSGAEVEFVTIVRFRSLDAVRAFAGEDYEVAVVPEEARTLLARFDQRAQHYEMRVDEMTR
jgi:heme-degrading monooxygenase HmoA